MLALNSLRTGKGSLLAGLVLAVILGYLALRTTFSSYYTAPASNSQLEYSEPERPQLIEPRVVESEVILHDGVQKYTRTIDSGSADLIWLMLNYNSESWGAGPDQIPRSIKNLTDLIASQYDTSRTSLGLLTSSQEQYDLFKSHIQAQDFPRVTILLHKGFNEGPPIDRANRHAEEFQLSRRAEIAKLRNYVMLKSLADERHIVWSDADVYKFDDGMVRRMVRHVQDNSTIGIITARCQYAGDPNYDKNAWYGTRKSPARGWDLDPKEIADGEENIQGEKLVDELIRDTDDDGYAEVTSVGGTIIYIRASLIWRGLSFPHHNVVGTRWNKDGWNGLETEGLCYRARGLKGGQCIVLGGSWHVEHTPDPLN